MAKKYVVTKRDMDLFRKAMFAADGMAVAVRDKLVATRSKPKRRKRRVSR